MTNIHSRIDRLTPEEFASIRGEIERAVRDAGNAEDLRVSYNPEQAAADVNIINITVESAIRFRSLLQILGRETFVEETDGPQRPIAA